MTLSFWKALTGESVKARALRGSMITIWSFAGGKILRMASNIILTRLLFPEAFGLMALVQVFMGGLTMFSDIGIRTSIMQSDRGDDPNFLNTAWTLQIIRGVVLWLAACALALPAAALYGEPMLAQLLPVVGLSAIISGFNTTNVASANRHLQLGRQTVIDLACQAFGILITIILALIFESVWALVFGTLAGAMVKRITLHLYMPGIQNRLHWDPSAVRELIGFGMYIFLGTACGFMIQQGDRAVLGGYISLADLGIYNVGMLMGTMPLLLTQALNQKIVMPLYRIKRPADSEANRTKIHKARRMMVVATLAMTLPLAYFGVLLINLMYDTRYALAGPIVVFYSFTVVPQIVFAGYNGALLSNGDSKRHFILLSTTAVLQVVFLFIGASQWGIFGAIVAPGLAAVCVYPMRVRFVSRYKANDHWADIMFLALGFAVNGIACWIHWDQILLLMN